MAHLGKSYVYATQFQSVFRKKQRRVELKFVGNFVAKRVLVESANQFSLEELCRTQYSKKYFFRSHVVLQTYGKTLRCEAYILFHSFFFLYTGDYLKCSSAQGMIQLGKIESFCFFQALLTRFACQVISFRNQDLLKENPLKNPWIICMVNQRQGVYWNVFPIYTFTKKNNFSFCYSVIGSEKLISKDN